MTNSLFLQLNLLPINTVAKRNKVIKNHSTLKKATIHDFKRKPSVLVIFPLFLFLLRQGLTV